MYVREGGYENVHCFVSAGQDLVLHLILESFMANSYVSFGLSNFRT